MFLSVKLFSIIGQQKQEVDTRAPQQGKTQQSEDIAQRFLFFWTAGL